MVDPFRTIAAAAVVAERSCHPAAAAAVSVRVVRYTRPVAQRSADSFAFVAMSAPDRVQVRVDRRQPVLTGAVAAVVDAARALRFVQVSVSLPAR